MGVRAFGVDLIDRFFPPGPSCSGLLSTVQETPDGAAHQSPLAKLKSGQSIDAVIAWATNELQGFAR